MNGIATKVGIAFNTKGKPKQALRVLESLKASGSFHLWNFEGGSDRIDPNYFTRQLINVIGGPDYAAVYALTALLRAPENYSHVGLIEDDVLMTDPNWFSRTMNLFEIGTAVGLSVGAVSARAYEDRILIQRPTYALMHNLGYGMIILTRQAAVIALDHVRTGMTSENRRVFCKLSGLDIGKWWAFREQEHAVCADWGLEKFLAIHGLASLALVPSPVEMIGQDPPLHQQGLRIADEPVRMLKNDKAFEDFVWRTRQVREGLDLGVSRHIYQATDGNWHYFPHQLFRSSLKPRLGWRTHWSFGMGPFALRSEYSEASMTLQVSGPAAFLFSGGPAGGKVMLEEPENKRRVEHRLPQESTDQAMEIMVSDDFVSHRLVRIVADPGVTLLRMRTAEQQMFDHGIKFDATHLPPPA